MDPLAQVISESVEGKTLMKNGVESEISLNMKCHGSVSAPHQTRGARTTRWGLGLEGAGPREKEAREKRVTSPGPAHLPPLTPTFRPTGETPQHKLKRHERSNTSGGARQSRGRLGQCGSAKSLPVLPRSLAGCVWSPQGWRRGAQIAAYIPAACASGSAGRVTQRGGNYTPQRCWEAASAL